MEFRPEASCNHRSVGGDFLTPTAIADLPRVESECVDETVQRYETIATGDILTRLPSSAPEINQLLEQNSPGSHSISVPVLLGQGDADQQVPVTLSDRLQDKYCALGVNVTKRTYNGVDHTGVIDAAAGDVLAFITARYAHGATVGDCG